MPTVPGGFLLGWECPWDLGLPMGSKGCCRVRGLYGAWGHQRGLLLPAGSMCAHGDGHLEVTVHHKAAVHVLQAQDDLGCVEPHLRLREDTVLREVIMQVPPCGKGDQLSLQHCPLLPQGRPNRRLQGRGSRESQPWGQGAATGLSPFMRSRMKLSLSGVWKAYDIHTMNGQSWHERRGQAALAVLRSIPPVASVPARSHARVPSPQC